MFGIYTHDTSLPVRQRLRALPRNKVDLLPADLALLQSLFNGSIHPDPVQQFLDFFSGLDSASEGEFLMEDSVQAFGAKEKWREMMRQGCESQVTAWLAAMFGAFNTNPPTEESPVGCNVVDDSTVNQLEFVAAGIFRRVFYLGRTSPVSVSVVITFYIELEPQL